MCVWEDPRTHISQNSTRTPAETAEYDEEHNSSDEENSTAFEPVRVQSPDDWDAWEATEQERVKQQNLLYDESDVSSWEDVQYGGSDTEAASDDEDLDGEDGETVNQEELIRQSRLREMPSVFDAVNALRQGVGRSFERSRSSSQHERERNASPRQVALLLFTLEHSQTTAVGVR